MNKFAIAALVLFLVLSMPTFAAGGRENADTYADPSLSLTDSNGKQVLLKSPPKRIVQAGKAAFIVVNTLYLFEEAGDLLVGLSTSDQGMGLFAERIDPRFGEKVVYGHNVSTEELLSLNPDIVISKDFHAASLEKSLSSMNIPVLSMNLENPDAFFKEIETLGRLFSNEDRAGAITDWYRKKLSDIEKAGAFRAGEQSLKTLLLYYSTADGTTTFSVPPLSWIQTDMIVKSGGIPVWKDIKLENQWTKVSFEQIAFWNPDVILIVSYRKPAIDVIQSIKQDPLWRPIKAVAAGRLYPFPGDFHSWDQPDPRWILGYEWVSEVLGGVTGEIDGKKMEKKARDFFAFAYGLGDESFNRIISPKLSGF